MVPTPNMHGNHRKRANKLSEGQVQRKSIPKYKSHYSRDKNINKQYLNCVMPITRQIIMCPGVENGVSVQLNRALTGKYFASSITEDSK